MNCMKCGRELKDTQVFCEECQRNMAQYPVKPGTPIQLPHRAVDPTPKKKNKKKAMKPEERLQQMRATFRWLVLALAVTLAAFVLTALLLLHLLDQQGEPAKGDLLPFSACVDVSRETIDYP